MRVLRKCNSAFETLLHRGNFSSGLRGWLSYVATPRTQQIAPNCCIAGLQALGTLRLSSNLALTKEQDCPLGRLRAVQFSTAVVRRSSHLTGTIWLRRLQRWIRLCSECARDPCFNPDFHSRYARWKLDIQVSSPTCTRVSRARLPMVVSRYRCDLLVGLSGIVISTRHASRHGWR